MTLKDLGKARFTVRQSDGIQRTIILLGRNRWALQELIEAGANGCTAIDNPGPRWSAYVHDLRHDHGLHIETVTEEHGPPFSGTHARYVLHSRVTRCLGVLA